MVDYQPSYLFLVKEESKMSSNLVKLGKDALGKRMKDNYETIPKTRLMRRTPVAIRIDGRAFHTFTRGFKRPFDDVLANSMHNTLEYLCNNIQGCVFGYTQSDEITLILCDYQTLTTDAWFDYEIQKMCSISASMATMIFNKEFSKAVDNVTIDIDNEEDDTKYINTLIKAKEKGAMFDSRCFNIPKEEVTNLIYWRQLDATRNSIQMVGQANFSHKQLQNKSCNEIQDMLYVQKGINWDDTPTRYKRGVACFRDESGWILDYEMPIIKGEDRDYVEKHIHFEEE